MTHHQERLQEIRAGSDGNEAQAPMGANVSVLPAPRRVDLSNYRDIRLEIAYVYRQLDAKRMEQDEAKSRVYILGELTKTIRTTETEERLAAMERILKTRQEDDWRKR